MDYEKCVPTLILPHYESERSIPRYISLCEIHAPFWCIILKPCTKIDNKFILLCGYIIMFLCGYTLPTHSVSHSINYSYTV